MVVKVRYPSKRGHEELSLSLEEGKEKIDTALQNRWIAAINKTLVRSSDSLKDGDEVTLFPAVSGG